VKVSSEADVRQPRDELVSVWTLAVAACLLAAVATASKTTLSLAVGGVILAAGGCLALIALTRLGDKIKLISAGPYAWVRHPFYLGLLLMLFGAVIVTRSPVGGVMFIPALGLTLARARREEHNLRLRFGARYDAYRRRVPFILPAMGRRPTLDPSENEHERSD